MLIPFPPPATVQNIVPEVIEKTEPKYQSVQDEVKANFLKIMKKVANDIYSRPGDQQLLTAEEAKQIKMLLSIYNRLFAPRTTSRRHKIEQWNEHVKAITQDTVTKLP
jgi:hypothetical protein